MTRKASPLLDVRWETGSKEWDKLLNGSPTITAVAFILLVEKPTREQPLLVEQCAPLLERLDMHGARKRPGPRADQVAGADTIRDALRDLGKVLNVVQEFFDEDHRRDFFYLAGPLPEIRIRAGDRRHYSDWESFRHMLWQILNEQPLAAIPNYEDILFPKGSGLPPVDESRKRKRAPRARSPKAARASASLNEAGKTKRKLLDVALNGEA